MRLKKALETEGWLTVREAMWLAGRAAGCSLIAEVGSWMGRSTLAIGMNTTGRVYAVDTWEGSPEHSDMLRSKPEDWLIQQFLSNVDGVESISPFISHSVPAADLMKKWGFKFDMIFLDASHDYESVKADILAWRPLLANDWSIICGHDFDPNGVHWPGVKRAVEECAPNFYVVPGTSIWVAEGTK